MTPWLGALLALVALAITYYGVTRHRAAQRSYYGGGY
jgi:hypothetical protein